ncbi:hypothetical protein V5O48_001166 [Marasmius crinis-equi]|uniref:Fungal-type protein kinase domain-containing protein n=1 Tax=Marasmius crinis-equi TaxID=585013 RepID=A0ABR3FZA3_9AGAR
MSSFTNQASSSEPTASIPKTPPNQAIPLQPALQATPHSQSASAASQDMTSFQVKDVRPFVRNDLKDTQNVGFQKFLLAMIRSLYSVDDSKAGKYLEDTLRATSRIAKKKSPNGLKGVQTKKVQDAIEEINSHLQKYCETEGETDRYEWFVKACNSALSVLEWVDKEGSKSALPPLPPTDIYFQRHDPTYISGTHHEGDESERKPDVIVASLKAVEDQWQKRQANTKIDVRGDAHLKAKYTVPWQDIRSVVEFKKHFKKLQEQLEVLMHAEEEQDAAPAQMPAKESEALSGEQIKRSIDDYLQQVESNPERSDSLASSSRDFSRTPRKRKEADTPVVKPPAKTNKARRSGKQKQNASTPPERPAEVQVIDYASEMLNASFGRVHALNWLITGALSSTVLFHANLRIDLAFLQDSTMSLWHFDRECPIQTNGIDFVYELPHFLAFLFLLQRFRLEDWGFIPAISPADESPIIDFSSAIDASPSGQQKPLCFYSKRRLLKFTYGTAGRCTQVREGNFGSSRVRAVLKLSCPEVSRDSEPDFIVEAQKSCNDDPETLACLPMLLANKDYKDFETTRIREFLGLEIVNKRPRIPRAVVLPFYFPITALTTGDWTGFMKAFWTLVRAHATLWTRGIQHGDISDANLMYEYQGGKVVPKLCDYDLAHFSHKEGPTGFTNTGTRRFMALDLLTGYAMKGMVKKEYRHDCESFAWVLIWIFGRYWDGKQIQDPDFDDWKNPHWQDITQQRADFIASGTDKKFVPKNVNLPEGLFALGFGMLTLLREASLEVSTKNIKKFNAEQAGRTEQCKALDKEIRQLNSLAYTVSEIMDSLLFTDAKYGAKIHREHLKRLTELKV